MKSEQGEECLRSYDKKHKTTIIQSGTGCSIRMKKHQNRVEETWRKCSAAVRVTDVLSICW